MTEIRNRWSNDVIYNGEGEDLRAVLVKAVAGGANLYGANLYGANLYGADLYGANLGADFPFHLFRICAEGSIVGWKKTASGRILCLEIPADAKRLNAIGSRKCRAEFALVRSVHEKDGILVKGAGVEKSSHDAEFTYAVGQEVRPDKFDASVTEECSNGIHFFITFEEARDY